MASEMIFANKPSCRSPNIGDSSKHVCSWGVIVLSTECFILAICAWQVSVHLNSDINDVLLAHKSRTNPCKCPSEQIPSERVNPDCCRKDVHEILQQVSRYSFSSLTFSPAFSLPSSPHSRAPDLSSLSSFPLSFPSILSLFFFFSRPFM